MQQTMSEATIIAIISLFIGNATAVIIAWMNVRTKIAALEVEVSNLKNDKSEQHSKLDKILDKVEKIQITCARNNNCDV